MIGSTKELAKACKKARKAGQVGIDTEFVWERSYYPSLGLVQIGFPDKTCELVDAVEITDWSPFAELMADAGTVKILHDAQQDLVILNRTCDALPKNIFDTQRVAGFVGLSSTVSLSELLKTLLRVRLLKTETRSDWLQRPLTEKQLKYAEDDVRYSAALREELLKRAEKNGRTAWIDEEMKIYEAHDLYEGSDPEAEMPRVKGSGSLTRTERDILRSLGAWRERNARRRNLPRSYIISDEGIMSLVRKPPHSASAIKVTKGLSQKVIDRHRDRIWAAIDRGIKGDLPPLPDGQHRGPAPDDGYEARVDMALAFVKGTCLKAGIDPALVGNRADISLIVREGEHALPEEHDILCGWREALCGGKLLSLLRGESHLKIDPESGFPTLP